MSIEAKCRFDGNKCAYGKECNTPCAEIKERYRKAVTYVKRQESKKEDKA